MKNFSTNFFTVIYRNRAISNQLIHLSQVTYKKISIHTFKKIQREVQEEVYLLMCFVSNKITNKFFKKTHIRGTLQKLNLACQRTVKQDIRKGVHQQNMISAKS